MDMTKFLPKPKKAPPPVMPKSDKPTPMPPPQEPIVPTDPEDFTVMESEFVLFQDRHPEWNTLWQRTVWYILRFPSPFPRTPYGVANWYREHGYSETDVREVCEHLVAAGTLVREYFDAVKFGYQIAPGVSV
jgi:hypothetical protein